MLTFLPGFYIIPDLFESGAGGAVVRTGLEAGKRRRREASEVLKWTLRHFLQHLFGAGQIRRRGVFRFDILDDAVIDDH